MRTQTILVAVDLDAHPEALVDEACDLAERLAARMVLVTVVPVQPSVDADVFQSPAAHPVSARQYREEAAEVAPRLRQLAQRARDRGLEVAAQVAHGDVADAILHLSAKIDAGLVVVGTHGRHGIARVALGSVAESVIRESAVPVVTIRAGTLPAKDRVAFHEVSLDDATRR